MQLDTYMQSEIEFFEKFNDGNNTVDLLLENSNLTEVTLNNVIDKLTANNTIKFNKTKKIYEYCEKLNKEKMIVLDGNIALPVSVIKMDGFTYVTRGTWYKFEGDFDIKNIIWNVELPNSNNKNVTLRELIQNQLMTHKKAKITQLEQYNSLRNLIVPYNDNLVLKLLTIGAEQTDTELIFNFKIKDSSGLETVSRKMKLKTVISTSELLTELSNPNHETRNYENIKINKIFNLTDFMVKGNFFPTKIEDNYIKYLELSQSRNEIVLTEYIHTFEDFVKTNEVHEFTIGDGFNYIRELFEKEINKTLDECGIYIDE